MRFPHFTKSISANANSVVPFSLTFVMEAGFWRRMKSVQIGAMSVNVCAGWGVDTQTFRWAHEICVDLSQAVEEVEPFLPPAHLAGIPQPQSFLDAFWPLGYRDYGAKRFGRNWTRTIHEIVS